MTLETFHDAFAGTALSAEWTLQQSGGTTTATVASGLLTLSNSGSNQWFRARTVTGRVWTPGTRVEVTIAPGSTVNGRHGMGVVFSGGGSVGLWRDRGWPRMFRSQNPDFWNAGITGLGSTLYERFGIELSSDSLTWTFVGWNGTAWDVLGTLAVGGAAVGSVATIELYEFGDNSAPTFTQVGQPAPLGPAVSAVSPVAGRASGTTVDITIDNSTGATAAAINGVALTGFTIVNATTVRGTTNGATTGPVSVTNASGTGSGPTFTVVPVLNQIRYQGGANPPWHPAAGPVLGMPYTLVLEAWNTTANARDTLATGSVSLQAEIVLPPAIAIVSGPSTAAWSAGLATFTNIVFGAADPRIPSSGGGPSPEPRAGLARFLAQHPKTARVLRAGKNPKGR